MWGTDQILKLSNHICMHIANQPNKPKRNPLIQSSLDFLRKF